ncbi:hypothetical protein, partial [Cylindrospermopsis raciborskii]|uniref:hypothetical protein n=1 Tax=Cylindrospermopsis raciborskii TaxID=77022 RepID=UPI0022CA9093
DDDKGKLKVINGRTTKEETEHEPPSPSLIGPRYVSSNFRQFRHRKMALIDEESDKNIQREGITHLQHATS